MKRFPAILILFASSFLSLAATAENVTVFFADGTTAQREAITSGPLFQKDLMQLANRGGGPGTVTLDTEVDLRETTNFTSILYATAGQEVNATTFFNALGSLEVPFANLVGRPIITYLAAPALGLSGNISVAIEAGDENVVGYGLFFDIPPDAGTMPFLMIGLNRIGGVATLNDTATTVRIVVGGP